MPRTKNKKLRKLREYRDKLLARTSDLEAKIRDRDSRLAEIRYALQQENSLRAYALSSPHSDPYEDSEWKEVVGLNDAITELTFVYRLLAMERDYTLEIDKALRANDLLRARALVEQHQEEQNKHDNLLQSWGAEHGFVRHLKGQWKKSLEGRK